MRGRGRSFIYWLDVWFQDRLLLSLSSGFVERFYGTGGIVDMGNILSKRESRERLARRPIRNVGGNRAHNLKTIGGTRIQNGTAADAVDSNAIDEVRMPTLLPRADIAREKAESIAVATNRGKAKPADFVADEQQILDWAQWYEILWKLKLATRKNNNG